MADVHQNYTDVRVFAQERVRNGINSGLYNRTPLLTIMSGKGNNIGTLGGSGEGRPASNAIYGVLPSGGTRTVDGGTNLLIPVQTERNTASANIGAKGTSPSAGNEFQSDKVIRATAPFVKRVTVVNIPKAYISAAMGPSQLEDVVGYSVDAAMEEHLQKINAEMITGNPTWDAGALLADELSGLALAVDSAGTYFGIDRSSATYWQAKETSSYGAFNLDIVDDANLGTSSRAGIMDTGPGINVILTTNVLYKKAKAEAIARGDYKAYDRAVENGTVGFLREGFYFNSTLFMYDPAIPSGIAYGLTLEDWEYHVHADGNYKVTSFKDKLEEGETGVQDVVTANIITQHTLVCVKPWNQIKYTSLT